MKKNILFLIPMLLVVVALFLLRATGMKVHIAVSVVGLVLLVAYTLATKKDWRKYANTYGKGWRKPLQHCKALFGACN